MMSLNTECISNVFEIIYNIQPNKSKSIVVSKRKKKEFIFKPECIIFDN